MEYTVWLWKLVPGNNVVCRIPGEWDSLGTVVRTTETMLVVRVGGRERSFDRKQGYLIPYSKVDSGRVLKPTTEDFVDFSVRKKVSNLLEELHSSDRYVLELRIALQNFLNAVS